MLTINKPVQYGYRSVHDLPTPPSTSRPSPPLIYQDSGHNKPSLAFAPAGSPHIQPMSASHRSLPPPVAMTSVQPPPGSGPSSQPPPVGQAPPPPPASQLQSYGQLPPAPPWQHEESMRTWLLAKTEEEKRKQEEEKTRQESFRLEQRRMEHDILRTSLAGGIPPPMVPVVFAGMGGGVLPQAALEWMQQYFAQSQQQQQQHPPALMPPGPIMPEHQRRDSQSQAYPHYSSSGVPSTPGSAQGPPYSSAYPGSPTRPRGQSMPGPLGGRPPQGNTSNLPAINTNVPPGQAGVASGTSHPGVSQQQPLQQQQQREEAQPSPSIYFHHWQPPTSQGGGGGGGGGRGSTDQPGTPSAIGESPRKRKAPGPQQPAPPPSSSQRFRSPPFSHSTGLSNPPPGRRRGHSRQRSDLGSYRARGRGAEGFTSQREASPMPPHPLGMGGGGGGFLREAGESSSSQQQQQQQQQQQHHHQQQQHQPPQQPQQQQQGPPLGRSGAHSVSSLLSDNPPSPRVPVSQFGAGAQQYGEGSGRNSPRSSEEKTRGGGSAATRAGDND
ncbi:hypothetical protein B0T16DRAFT_321704 [Cercophora newfieldiana]|uniref:Uncharacterized protein n=1 Tax=Cercophora newfieldiana TaxID=92897 RepID=A0AA39YG48_9PEZI|nr:hypothetical protein B0T16DRAFT_321704 [Cercophora newfieldiana]